MTSNMISPRTLSLRHKNRELLKQLQQNVSLLTNPLVLSSSQSSEEDAEGVSHLDTACSCPLERRSTHVDHEEPLNHGVCGATSVLQMHYGDWLTSKKENLGDLSLTSEKDSYLDRDYRTKHEGVPLSTAFKYHDDWKFENTTQTFSDETSFISVQGLKKVVNDALRQVPKQAFENLQKPATKQKICKRSSSEPRTCMHGNDKMSLIDQQLAADAHMHAPTHTHSVSRCYCLRSNSVGRLPYQLYCRTRQVPTRLKDKRYRTDRPLRPQRTVTWAADSHCSSEPSLPKSLHHQFHTHNTSTSSDAWSLEHVVSDRGSKESECGRNNQDLFNEVKRFRQAHWFDCHASPRTSTIFPEHKCVYHYVLNDRLFLEPVSSDCGRCPVCLLPAPSAKLSTPPGLTRLTTPPPPVSESSTLVTLPKRLLDPQSQTTFTPTVSTKGLVSKKKRSEQPCFLTHHTKTVFRPHCHIQYTDSLALRHQKGIREKVTKIVAG